MLYGYLNFAFLAPDHGFSMPFNLQNLDYLGLINYKLLTDSSGHCRMEIFNIPPFCYKMRLSFHSFGYLQRKLPHIVGRKKYCAQALLTQLEETTQNSLRDTKTYIRFTNLDAKSPVSEWMTSPQNSKDMILGPLILRLFRIDAYMPSLLRCVIISKKFSVFPRLK